jgi:hypothetical protein
MNAGQEFCKISTSRGKTNISFTKASQAMDWHQKILLFIEKELSN